MFQSHELVIVVSLIATFFGLRILGPISLGAMERGIQTMFSLGATLEDVGGGDLHGLFLACCSTFLTAALPLMLIAVLVAVAITFAQTKMLFSFEALKFKGERISPLKGFKRMFSLRAVVEMLKAMVKITLLGFLIYRVFLDYIPKMPAMMDMSVAQAMGMTGEMILSLVESVAIAAVFVAAADYLYQWWDYEKNLRMSKQELKEEYKQTEGDPQIKSKIKERQQQQARRRMMQNVPNADVVIRNPTHYAIAVQYQPEKNRAPIVIAKGADAVALRIVHVAEEHDIVIMENRPLARGLYEAVEIDQEIPEQFYQAVAEVLAFVYGVKKKGLN